MMKGNLGQPPGGFPKGIVDKVLKGGAKPDTSRPGGAHLKPVDLEKARAELSAELEGFKVDDEDLNGYLMYPKVFLDYMGRHRTYGPVRTLPTRTFFYGMEPGEEIEAEIDPPARPWKSVCRRLARHVKMARPRYSSNSTANRA